MFDIGFFELCIIGVVALLVLGPQRLPRAARTAGMWVGRAKRMVAQVKRDIDDELRQEELQELREAQESLSQTRESMKSFQQELNEQVDTDGGEKRSAPASGTPAEAGGRPKASEPNPDRQVEADDDTKQSASGSGAPAESRPNENKSE